MEPRLRSSLSTWMSALSPPVCSFTRRKTTLFHGELDVLPSRQKLDCIWRNSNIDYDTACL